AAVSGGPDSLALALLAQRWVAGCGGTLLALIVDHRLRPESSREAAETLARLAGQRIPARVLTLSGLHPGPALAERARQARYAILLETCRAEGILHLLLGHHAADQGETVLMRALSKSGPAGLAGMAAIVETAYVRLLRPLLSIAPEQLRDVLAEAGVAWVEDPSNVDPRALRPRLRALRADRIGSGPATKALSEAADRAGQLRAEHERETASLLGRITLRPEGFAVIESPSLPAAILSALMQAVSGAAYPPRHRSLASLASALRPATLGGTRLMEGGRMGRFLLLREMTALQPPVPACPGATWDERFRIDMPPGAATDLTFGALGDDTPRIRAYSDLPAAVLRTLPALRRHGTLVAVPHIEYPDAAACAAFAVTFRPARPVAGAPYFAP
ncbi:MAG TPA: tRNA lysidine(34) synthetase TilS, partial [Acetobacteraceae bacterium]